MSHNLPPSQEVEPKPVDDNARKFTVEALSAEYLSDVRASSFVLTVDWLQMGEDDETKLAHKEYEDGTLEVFLIIKETLNGNRTSVKTPISEEKYREQLINSQRRISKRRSEFKYVQDHVVFNMKYDEFYGSELRLLEVDALPGEEKKPFDPSEFGEDLTEVSDDPRYTGYRITEMLYDY